MLRTIEEYREQAAQLNRRSSRELMVGFSTTLVLAFMVAGATKWFETGSGQGLGLLLFPLTAVACGPMLLAVWRTEHPGKRFPALKCPHCGGAFIPRGHRIVIATRHCTRCGRQMVRFAEEVA